MLLRARRPFALTKWYLDCVAADGRAVIGYWASLAYRGMALTWQSVTVYEPGAAGTARTSLAPSPPPRKTGDWILWRCPALGCVAAFEPSQRPFGECLLNVDDGVVDWRVEAPAARVSFDLGGSAAVKGAGYAERIFISLPVWRLPIRELRWGRWLDTQANRSVVWIDWRGEAPGTWVFVDGARSAVATVTDEGITADGMALALGARRALHERNLGETLAGIPALHAMVPASVRALREVKWCSDGTLRAGNETQRGRAIHELAVLR
jgi:hypothetical protein